MKIAFLIVAISSFLFGEGHIFLLHRFDDNRYKSTNISTKKLEAEFQFLKKNGYKVVSMDYFLSHMDEKGLITFTIDDSYKSFYEHGFPLFKKYNFPFTLFLYVEAIDRNYRDFMSWDEVREVAKYGEIGIHSYSHPHPTHLTPIEIMKDTQKAIESYKKHLKMTPKYYAYPYGEYDKTVREVIEAFGFKAIFNQSIGAVSKDSDIYNLYRIPLLGKFSIKDKLRIKYLKADWILPKRYPLDGYLKRITLVVPEDIDLVEVYISGFRWQTVSVGEFGLVDIKFPNPVKLKYNLTRIFVKTFDNRFNSTLIVK
jgi:peptidoglycan/xylan/chitin deacetylase (PgdA/CDA1 family)